MAAGTYVRLAFVAGAGQWWADGESGASYTVEALGRFHLDPFRTAKFGLYGVGGVVTNRFWRAGSMSRLVAGVGVELPAHGRATWALEAVLAGGYRVSLVTRRLPLGRR